jgi:FAD binding domain of DNA photolyase
MQAGTTGINAMRVYNVTKQGKDQDSTGKFIKRYVPELASVPDRYIHEPWKMPQSAQLKCKTFVGGRTADCNAQFEEGWSWYPDPIVDEQESARVAKAKLSAVRKEQSTKELAKKVYVRHGSRSRSSSEMNGRMAIVSEVEVQMEGRSKQLRINELFSQSDGASASCDNGNTNRSRTEDGHSVSDRKRTREHSPTRKKGWACLACTYWNDNPHRLLCSMCLTKKATK